LVRETSHVEEAMRPKANTLRSLALSVVIAACGIVHKAPVRRPLLGGLPVDSLIKTLGPDVAKYGMSVGVGTSDDKAARFEETYTADFHAPRADQLVVSDLAAQVSAIVTRRGGRLRGSSSSGAFTTIDYSADSVYGWVAIAPIKSDRPNLDRFVILVREIATHVP